MNHRHDRRTRSRVQIMVGFALTSLCVLFGSLSARGQESRFGGLVPDATAPPAVVIVARDAKPWSSTLNIAAPLDAPLSFELDGCTVIAPYPCSFVIPAGGTLSLGSDFFDGALFRPGVQIIEAPAGAATVSAFLTFGAGPGRTAFAAPALTDRLEVDGDVFRAVVAARIGDVSTCITAFAPGDSTALTIGSRGPDGLPALDSDGHLAPLDVVIVPAHGLVQACLGDTLDGSVLTLGPTFTSGSVWLSFGCGGVGPCPLPSAVYPLVTRGPLTGATIETLALERVSGELDELFNLQISASSRSIQRPIHLHGDASPELRRAVEAHNAASDLRRLLLSAVTPADQTGTK